MENNNMEKIDQETLFIILKEHQLWLESNGRNGKKADLSNKNLIGADLEGANLRGANLRGANLIGANLIGANLREANLIEAYLIGAYLIGAYLIGANLREASLIEASLIEASLIEANLIEANLRGANLKGAYLRGANLRGANLEGAYLERANLIGADLEGTNLNTQFLGSADLFTDDLKRKLQSSEVTIRELEENLKQAQQAQSEKVKNDEEITKLSARLEQEKLEKEKIKEELNSKIEELTEGLSNRIKDAQKSLSGALKNTDSQIQNNENTACWFKWLGIILFGLAIILLLVFSGFVLCNSKFFIEKNLNILFYTFPIITLMLIGTTCLRHQKNLLAEVRHFSNMKHQIELYSGLLEASQHAAASFDNPEKANEYVQETFTQIRNRLLNSQYLPDNSSADKQSDNDFGSDKVLDLLNKIADLSGKKSMGN
ncbi:hypothetical protein LST1_13620 [Neisseria elongata]|uniref:pentapeptide repeat-containing protein n=1 Tax=Neisseria elongata TaxID=495 RepID=UPI002852E189|nr:hypothetical protein LST1_13620 [Neisseria elongata]